MRFDNSLNFLNLPENKLDVSSIDYDVFGTNYNNYKLSPENDGVYLEDDNNKKVYKLEENNKRVYVTAVNYSTKLCSCFDMARFDGLNKDIYTRVNCLGNDLFIEEYTTSNENMLSLSIYKDVRAYLTSSLGDITCDTFDKIPEILEALSIVPDAQIVVEYKSDAKRDVYTVRSFVDGMRLLDNNSMFCPVYELDEHYAKASGYAKAKYRELIKPLLELPIEFRQIAMAKLDNKEFKI